LTRTSRAGGSCSCTAKARTGFAVMIAVCYPEGVAA
jgi:hypothetical protein